MKNILLCIIIITLCIDTCSLSIAKENNKSDEYKDTGVIANERYDLPIWAVEALNYLVNEELIYIGTDPKFDANKGSSRGDFVLLLMRCLNKANNNIDASERFDDVDYNSYYSMAIYNAKIEGLVYGDSENKFYPDRNGTRQEFVTILYRVIEKYSLKPLPTINEYPFKDTNYAEYAKEAISILHELNIVNGYRDGYFYPTNEMTRAEMIKVIYEVMKYLNMVDN